MPQVENIEKLIMIGRAERGIESKSAAGAADLTLTARILKRRPVGLREKELKCGLFQDFSQSMQPG